MRPWLLITAAVFIAYFNAFQGGFQFDDFNVIVGEARVHSWQAWLASMPGIRPLLKASYTLNWVSGLGLYGFHLLNIAAHTASATLVYLLARRYFVEIAPLPESAGRSAALFAALLFALHPAQTEAVTYISGRSSSLATSFYLASLLAYDRSRQAGSPRTFRYVSLIFFLMALAVKEIVVTLPLALFLWEFCRPSRRSVRNILAALWPYWMTLAAAMLAMLLHPVYFDLLAYSLNQRHLDDSLYADVQGAAYLLGQLFFPLHLNIDPDLSLLAAGGGEFASKAALLGLLLAAGLASLQRASWLAFGILWFFVQLLPAHTLIPRLDIANDRQLYLASPGPLLVLAYILAQLAIRWPTLPWRTLAVAACVLLALATHARNRDYRDEITLWEATAKYSPNKGRVHNNLGYAYELADRKEDARKAYRRALEIDPKYARATINLRAMERAH
jgi:hypothetical protein